MESPAWWEWTLEQSVAAAIEPLCDALMAAGAVSVSIEDADENSLDETPIYGEPGSSPAQQWRRNTLKVLFATVDFSAHQSRVLIADLAHQYGVALHPLSPQPAAIAAQDWVRATQAQFAPIEISPQLRIVPSWHWSSDSSVNNIANTSRTSIKSAIELRLDPGLAFGTGSHPTTALCLRYLEQNFQAGQSLLDYGCGSGILGLLASKKGAAWVLASDLDPAALVTTRENAQINQCQLEVCAVDEVSAQLTRLNAKQRVGGGVGADWVVANILTNPLTILAPLLCASLAPNGCLLLSGILTAQAEQIRAAYAPYVSLKIVAEQETWVAMCNRSELI